MYSIDRAKFKTYQDFALDFQRCRNVSIGRPIKNWCRLYKDGKDYVVKQVGWRGANVPLFKVSPDNTLTFVMPLENLLHHTQTVVSSLYRVVPITIERKRKGIYALAGMNDEAFQEEGRIGWGKVKSQGAEYFCGLQFDLITGQCLNKQPHMMDTVIPEKRKQWLRDVKRYKKGLKVRAKLGALQGFLPAIAKEEADAGGGWRYRRTVPKWEAPDIAQHVVECMRTEDYPQDILKLIAQTTQLGWGNDTITDQMMLANVDAVFDKCSLQYRKLYGVFGETLHKKA
jgi:hypothetical protein